MYESRHTPPISFGKFLLRLMWHGFVVLILVGLSLLVGMVGYHHIEHMEWLDAFLNTSMLLGGMGPVKTEGLSSDGKLFAGIYALYAGLCFIAVISIMLSPVIHRMMHSFHWKECEDPD
jgi:hypothetical protein